MEIKSSFWIYIILILCLVSLVLITTFSSQITMKIIEKREIKNLHGFTKAVCDNQNYCEDYEIVCEQKQVKSFTPTGMAIQNPSSWQDSRTSEQIEQVCG